MTDKIVVESDHSLFPYFYRLFKKDNVLVLSYNKEDQVIMEMRVCVES